MDENVKSNEWPKWFFGPGGREGVFDNQDDVPEGWVAHPSLLPPEKALDL